MTILKELRDKIPKNANISEVKFEGSEIVLYTKSKEFFRESEEPVREIVRELKKRVQIRPDISITMDPEKTKEEIGRIVPEGAGVKAVYFEPELGKVVIEAQKPGLIIGRNGETYKRIKNETLWLPKIERAPAIKSDIVRAVRNLLHSEIPYRKKFLNKIGQHINTATISEENKKEEWIRLSCLGGFRQVGRSSMLLHTPYSRVLMDCGADPTSEKHPYIEAPEFDMEKLDAIILSHAHTDHCGYIPYLYEQGFMGPMYCTAPTRDLMVLLCLDYIDVCQKEGKPAPYSKKAVEKVVKHSIVIDYGEVSDITPDMRLTLQPSGHLLGGSLVHVHIGDGLHNVLYTGDLNFSSTSLFEPAYTNFQRVETLIIESTYGGADNIFPPRTDAEKEFIDKLNKTMQEGGKALVPSFAVGRAQEIMCILVEYGFQYPVYMEGMLWDATAIHTAYPEYLSRHLQRSIFHYGKNPFLSEIFKRVAPKERSNVIDSAEPCVVIATSGMLMGGPAVEYLKGFAPDPKNNLVFVGYQAEGSLGSRVQKGWKEIPIRDDKGRQVALPLKLQVDTIHGLSGHAGRIQLVNFVKKLSSRPERIIVNHGEPKRSLEFASDIHKMIKCETVVPKNLDAIRLR